MAPQSPGFDDARQFWDQRYGAPEYIFGTAPNRFLASQQSLFRPGHQVLDVACGEGRNSVWLATLGCDVLEGRVAPLALESRTTRAERGEVTWWRRTSELAVGARSLRYCRHHLHSVC
jgi:2-polyprenyl-3-methyl-5-hydroxy-6-metoxy-1,4-benzoquinol methylase